MTRAFWIGTFLLALAGCGGRVSVRPRPVIGVPSLTALRVQAQVRASAVASPAAPLDVHQQAEVGVQAQGEARVQGNGGFEAAAQGQGEADVQATGSVAFDPTVAVAIEGADVVEFFGIPLGNAQDVVFVLDRSGSMDEPAQASWASFDKDKPAAPPRKIDVAQRELSDALSRLTDGTRVNVIFFNDVLGAYAPLPVALDGARREAAIKFVRGTFPDGRTALAPAMRAAFLMNARRIVLLSDGLGNVGGDADDIMRDAREAMLGDVRIDTIGLGSGQDAALLGTLATESGGIYQRLE